MADTTTQNTYFNEWFGKTPEELTTYRSFWEGLYQNGNLSYDQYMQLFNKATGTTATPTGDTPSATPTTYGPLTQAQSAYLQEEPQTEWNRAFNLPSVGGNPFQKWLESQAGPAYSAYAARNTLNIPQGGQPDTFQNYLGSAGQGIPMAGQTALGTLRGVRGLNATGQGDWLDTFRSSAGEGGAGGSLSDLMQAAIQGRGFASPFARAAARNTPGYERQWNTETLGGSTVGSPSFMEYLMKRLGIS